MLLLNEAKPKYDYLDTLLSDTISNIKFSQQVNIIVDLKEVIKKFFRPDFEVTNLAPEKQLVEEMASDIINIISHYRNYFYKRNKFSTFYFLYSKTECELLKNSYPDYKKEYYENYFNSEENSEKIEITKKAIKIIEKVLKVVPNAGLIDTSDYDELVYARYITENSEKNELNLILSNDTIFYQLLNEHTILLNLKGIKTQLVTEENAVSILTKREDYKFSPSLIPLVVSLSGNKKYSFASVPHVALIKACTIIKHLLEIEKIQNIGTIDFPFNFAELSEADKLEKILINNKDQIVETYKLARADEILYKNTINIQKNIIISMQKLNVGKSVFLELNAKIFSMFPLQLDMLLRGEKI